MRRTAAAALLASLLTGILGPAVCAHAQTAVPFPPVESAPPPARSHRLADATLVAGLALIAASFPLATTSDRRYEEYLAESDPSAIESRWDAAQRADRLASASLLTGEVLLAAGVYLRFLRRAPDSKLRFAASATRCAVTLRF